MVVIVVLHMLRVIFWGSYKRPREATWLIGVILLLIVMTFSFTGYLLPWDQRAYWATVVGTRIAGTTPVVGQALQRILRGGDEVGAATLSRFFAVHTILLPLLLFGFAVFHVFLVRRHGSSGHWSLVEGVNAEKEPFYPRQFWRDAAASMVLLAVVFFLAILAPPSLEPIADPADTRYVPRPEWYFLGLFQLLHYFKKHWEILGTLVIPAGLVVLLAILPWLDRGIQRNPFRRPWVSGMTACLVVIAVAFTIIPILDDRHEAAAHKRMERILPTLSSELREGYRIYDRHACWNCHGIDGTGRPMGPDLSDVGERFSRKYISDHIVDPTRHVPRSEMPKTKLSKRELDLLVRYVLSVGSH